MKILRLFALLLCGIKGQAMGSTLKLFSNTNIEELVLHLEEKMISMEERFLLLEYRESPDTVQKIKNEVLLEVHNAETRFSEEKRQLVEELTKVKSFMNKQNDLSNKLDEIAQNSSKQRDQILNTLTQMEKASKLSCDEVSEKMLNEKNRLLLMDNHLLLEIYDLQKKMVETGAKVTTAENNLMRKYEKSKIKINLMEMKLNETMDILQRCVTHKDIEEAFRKNLTQALEKQRMHINNSLVSRLENVTAKIGSIEISLTTLRKQCVNLSYVSHLYNQTTSELRSVRSDHAEDINDLKVVLTNHTFHIRNINTQLYDIVCSPPCENGGRCLENNVCNCTPSFIGARCQYDVSQCGLDYDTVDINGSRNSGENNSNTLVPPWMAVVTKDQGYWCDGSIIHSRFILTAAACLEGMSSDETTVQLGLTDFKDRAHLQEYNVRFIHIHPEFNETNNDNNIALVELEKRIDYNLYIRKICLPPKDIPDENPFYKPQSFVRAITLKTYMKAISSSQNISPNSLKNMDFIVQTHDVCERKIKESEWEYYYPSTDRMVCAHGKDYASSACYDLTIGVPVIQSSQTKDGVRIWTQVGVKSSGCFINKKYLFASHLQFYMQWIDETIEATCKK